jgi:helicase MOV-10
MKLYNEHVYAGALRCCTDLATTKLEWPSIVANEHGDKHPVIFHHLVGEERREEDSPSWLNEDEIKQVIEYTKDLLAHGCVAAEEIGIISPYQKQCQRLRSALRAERIRSVDVGTTEIFQGREKQVIIATTVRSLKAEEITNDIRLTLGFLGNYKRTNVVLSRAKALLIVVGNLHVLSKDDMWNKVLRTVDKMGSIRGEPFAMEVPTIRDDGVRFVQTSAGVADGEMVWPERL